MLNRRPFVNRTAIQRKGGHVRERFDRVGITRLAAHKRRLLERNQEIIDADRASLVGPEFDTVSADGEFLHQTAVSLNDEFGHECIPVLQADAIAA